MSLFRTELRRLVKRRFVRYVVLAGLAVLAAVAVGTFLTNEKVGPAQIAAAERTAEREYQQNLAWTEQFREECERAKEVGGADDEEYPDNCAEITSPTRDQFQAEWHMPATFDFRASFGESITTYAAILALVGFVAGASFVGAEWTSGGMMNLLLWRPQRIRVLLTKLGALLTGLAGVSVLAATAWTLAFWLTGVYRGTTEGMTPGVWQSFALTGLRGTVLVLAVSVIGFALASLGRHTAFALGGVVGVLVVGQFGVGIVLAMAQVRFLEMWLVPTYVLAWMNKSVTLEDWQSCEYSVAGGCSPRSFEIVWQHSGALMVAVVLLTLGAAIWTIRRRDIT